MDNNIAIIILYSIALIIIGFLLYSVIHRPKKIQIINKSHQLQQFPSEWWGYGWRPWWRRYRGLPGVGEVKPLSKPQMPKPSKPIIIPNTS